MFAPATDRFRHSASGISGDRATNRSCATKYPISAAATASSAIVRADPHRWLPVCTTAYASRLVPAVTLSAPPTSKPPRAAASREPSAGSSRSAAATTTAPTGRLTRKIHRQPTALTSTPAEHQPERPGRGRHPAPDRERPVAGRPGGNTELSRASVIGTTNAAASPSAARVPTITPADGASADPSDASANTAVPATSTRRRPSRSPARPPSSRNPPNGTMYAFTIHDSPLSENRSDSRIAGMATLTTVTSTVSSSAARHSTTSVSTCRRVHEKEAAASPAESLMSSSLLIG